MYANLLCVFFISNYEQKQRQETFDYENEMIRYVDTCKWCVNARMKLADATKPAQWMNERTSVRDNNMIRTAGDFQSFENQNEWEPTSKRNSILTEKLQFLALVRHVCVRCCYLVIHVYIFCQLQIAE